MRCLQIGKRTGLSVGVLHALCCDSGELMTGRKYGEDTANIMMQDMTHSMGMYLRGR